MYIHGLPARRGLASLNHLRAGTTCSAHHGKGQHDRAYLSIRPRDGGRRLPSLRLTTVTTRPGSVPQLTFGADGHGPRLG